MDYLGDGPKSIDYYKMEDLTVFFTDVPAETVKTVYVYFSTDFNIFTSMEKEYSELFNILSAGKNLLKNSSFEDFNQNIMHEDWYRVVPEGSTCHDL